MIFSIAAGLFIALHGVFNARMSETLSTWHTITMVHFIGFLVAIVIYVLKRDGRSDGFRKVPFLYLLGGTFGVIIVLGEMSAIKQLGMSFAIALLLIAQLLCAFLIDAKGLFGTKKLQITKQQLAGMVIMVIGVIVFQL
ncbi:DMT family transporter [Jeotgalibacillus sp. S-D1]|uniref:DMT family transporter n=1 Tax=Jeotgalibacillus sp. S-D1 TaxID=2552189 RepID=UPI001F0DC68C|nr:DMT family transporter [Jeotgalibacillus sp. S-D1]